VLFVLGLSRSRVFLGWSGVIAPDDFGIPRPVGAEGELCLKFNFLRDVFLPPLWEIFAFFGLLLEAFSFPFSREPFFAWKDSSSAVGPVFPSVFVRARVPPPPPLTLRIS